MNNVLWIIIIWIKKYVKSFNGLDDWLKYDDFFDSFCTLNWKNQIKSHEIIEISFLKLCQYLYIINFFVRLITKRILQLIADKIDQSIAISSTSCLSR